MRITQKVFYDLAIWMVVLGLSIGIVFPFFVETLGVPADIALKPLFFTACLGAGALAGILNYSVARTIVGARLKILASSMHDVEVNLNEMTASGDFSKCTPENCFISVDSEDEIGESAQAFNRLIESLSISLKTHEAIRSFSEVLSSHLDLENLSENALIHFFKHTEAQGGLILYELEGKLKCAASQRLHNPDLIVSSDYIAAAMRTGQRQVISLPEDVQTTDFMMDFKPNEIIVSPVIYKNEPFGVVVLATEQTFDANHLARVDLFVKGLGLAFNNVMVHDRLKTLAARDPLTGVYNRRFGFDRLHEEYRRTVRSSMPLGILMFDIDHFKMTNDTYGHLVGDYVLKSICNIVRSSLRENDVLFRYGGEEFVAILPGASTDELHVVGERLRKAIEEYQFSDAYKTLRTTVSIGGATSTFQNVEAEYMLIRLADEALYRAKELGRNRLEIANVSTATEK
jgi:diguanylate cyclase (GGDEF)-like protein